MATTLEEDVFSLVSNIPDSFHSRDLRNYFSQLVEGRKFKCFHFRNRPEHKLQKTGGIAPNDQFSASRDTVEVEREPSFSNTLAEPPEGPDSAISNSICIPPHQPNIHVVEKEGSKLERDRRKAEGISACQSTNSQSNDDDTWTRRTDRKCCIIKISSQNLKKLLQLYHKKPWVDHSGNAMGIRCFIVGIKVSKQGFTGDDLLKLPELNPPGIMPRGNVGTPTQSFLQLIRDCQIPPSVIRKLGLTFPQRRSNRMYGNVPFHYGGRTAPGSSSEGVDEGDEVARTATGEEIVDERELGLTRPVADGVTHDSSEGEQRPDSGEDDDDDTCEEWERHEAFHEDVTKQDRTGERLFEEEMEIVWDKGSSGLVFYTDAAYWDAMKGDFDERTSDEWDVDMSIFYEKDGGTKDARDWLQIQKEQRRGKEDTSVFTKGQIGQFECHTKGFGRQLMGQLGWRDGEGLGRGKRGMRDALDNEGQTSRDKRGFGYHGEKLSRYPAKKNGTEGAIISTVYDKPEETDPPATLLRAVEPTHLKHREKIL